MLGIYSLILIVIDSTRGLALAADTPKGGIGGIFKLPELVVHTNSSYLLRQFQTHLECRISGQPLGDWPNVTLERLLWMKDGTPVAELHNSDITVNEPTAGSELGTTPVLRIIHATHQSEGDYQCSAILRNVVVKPNQAVDSRLVSAPLKLRRARITKFERYESQPIVRVKQGQVARLACFGLPDVIPGPPEVSFEKHGHEGVLLGRTGNERFIATPSGLQIALTQPSDAGRYFCVVRNVFTNQTRRAPRPVVLVVEPTALSDYRASQNTYHGHRNFSRRTGHYFDNFDIPLTTTPPAPLPTPRIVYPEALNYSEPIELHVVTGQTAILECVIWEAKIMWNNPSFTMPAVSLTDDRARIRQIWGNLRIKQVTAEDSGDYVCHGLAWPTTLLTAQDLTARLLEPTHPRVTYRLIVHAPTSVRLMLAQQVQDKSWQLSCYAHNLRYEIPMVYVNGLPLIDAMEEMGVPPQTNFYTNPINVTLRANNPLSGSIQCISRPAMDEAEVYGFELERGRAMNLYVDDRLNQRIAPLPKKTTEKYLQLTPTGEQKSAQTVRTTEAPSIKPQKIEEENMDQNKVLGLLSEKKDSKAPVETIQKKFEILQPMAFVAGDQSVRIQWSIQPSDHPQLTRLLNFGVEMKRKEKGATRKDEEFNEDEEDAEDSPDEWVVKDHVQPHVRALTVRRLVPNSEYQFRITANFNDRTNATSQPTSWLIIEAAAPMLPLAPQITRLQTVSHDSMLLAWNHSSTQTALFWDNQQIRPPKEGGLADKFVVSYMPLYSGSAANFGDGEILRFDVGGNSNEILLSDLESDMEYKVYIVAENKAGKSPQSRPRIARTYVMAPSDYDSTSSVWWGKFRRDQLHLPEMSLKFLVMFGALCLAAILLIVLCCLTACRLREWRRQSRGGSIDSTNRFFGANAISPASSSSSSHRLRKRDRQLYHEPCFFATNDPISELSPLGCYADETDKKPSNLSHNSTRLPSRQEDSLPEGGYINRLTLHGSNDGTNSTKKRPNLYGNPDVLLDDLFEDIYGTRNGQYLNQNALNSHTNSLSQLPPIGTGHGSGTLARVASRRSTTTATPLVPPPMMIRPKSPSPSAFSAFMNRSIGPGVHNDADAAVYYNELMANVLGQQINNTNGLMNTAPAQKFSPVNISDNSHYSSQNGHSRSGSGSAGNRRILSYSPDSCTVTTTTNSSVVAADSQNNSPHRISPNDQRLPASRGYANTNGLSIYNNTNNHLVGSHISLAESTAPPPSHSNFNNQRNMNSHPQNQPSSMSTFKAGQPASVINESPYDNYRTFVSNNGTIGRQNGTLDRRKRTATTNILIPKGSFSSISNGSDEGQKSLMMRSLTRLPNAN